MATDVTTWVNVDALPLHARHSFNFSIVQLADRSSIVVPIDVLVGARQRPRCVAVAGIHGDEPEGMLALLEFCASCNLRDLQGTMVIVPVANPPAFAAHQRRSPLDALDLNRTFPGRRDGTPSERLAYHLLHDVVADADFLFSLHSWYSTGTVVPYVELPEGDDAVSRQSFEAAVAAGFRRLRRGDWPLLPEYS